MELHVMTCFSYFQFLMEKISNMVSHINTMERQSMRNFSKIKFQKATHLCEPKKCFVHLRKTFHKDQFKLSGCQLYDRGFPCCTQLCPKFTSNSKLFQSVHVQFIRKQAILFSPYALHGQWLTELQGHVWAQQDILTFF